jgi:hypothetical protein
MTIERAASPIGASCERTSSPDLTKRSETSPNGRPCAKCGRLSIARIQAVSNETAHRHIPWPVFSRLGHFRAYNVSRYLISRGIQLSYRSRKPEMSVVSH